MRWMALSVVAVPVMALAQPVGRVIGREELVAPPLPGFVVGFEQGNERGGIREEIPRGETVQAWTRMVTTQRFAGVALRASPQVYIRNSMAGLPRSCPGAKMSAVDGLVISRRPAARVMVDCPRNAQGSPEAFIMLAIAGPSGDMHVKQVAWRRRPTGQDLTWAAGFLGGVALCTSGDRTPKCR